MMEGYTDNVIYNENPSPTKKIDDTQKILKTSGEGTRKTLNNSNSIKKGGSQVSAINSRQSLLKDSVVGKSRESKLRNNGNNNSSGISKRNSRDTQKTMKSPNSIKKDDSQRQSIHLAKDMVVEKSGETELRNNGFNSSSGISKGDSRSSGNNLDLVKIPKLEEKQGSSDLSGPKCQNDNITTYRDSKQDSASGSRKTLEGTNIKSKENMNDLSRSKTDANQIAKAEQNITDPNMLNNDTNQNNNTTNKNDLTNLNDMGMIEESNTGNNKSAVKQPDIPILDGILEEGNQKNDNLHEDITGENVNLHEDIPGENVNLFEDITGENDHGKNIDINQDDINVDDNVDLKL